MSNEEQKKLTLDYPISILIAERDNIHGLNKNQADKLNRAIEILNKVKMKEQINKRERNKIEKALR